jgi:serine/threonine-protein kinase
VTKIGDIIDGKYEILKKIGQGGMSIVFLAMDKRLNKQWAVKEIRKEANGKHNEVIVQSLLAEANLMKRLDHPSLPRIVDIIDNGDTIYVVMDYIEGEPMDKIIFEYGAQPQDRVIEWAKQICDVLQYLHLQKPAIIYRDMKPANIMLKPDGNLKVIDFGIAREYKEQNLADTISLGTKGYAAPEQFGGKGQTDARTDIYCLGVTLYHLLTGKNPCEPPYELYPIRYWNASLSGGLERIIQKCTQLNPEDRYQNCTELMYALEHYEEEDDVYRNAQKKKLKTFAVTAGLCLLMLLTGVSGLYLYSTEKSKNYAIKVGISPSTEYGTKVDTYKDAINLINNDSRAYVALLQAYKDNNRFGDVESGQINQLYNQNKESFKQDGSEFLTLNYEIGLTYFYYYSGGDNTFRTRVLKSYPYFKEVVQQGSSKFKNYKLAESFYTIGNFYSQYIVTGTNEPTAENYETLLTSLNTCVNNVDSYQSPDAAYIKLTMYQEINNLLNDRRKGFAATGIDKTSILDLLQTCKAKAAELTVTQNISLDLQEQIATNYESYATAIERSYINTEGRGEE